MRVTTKIDFF